MIVENEIQQSKEVGVLFRPERGASFAGHRNRIEHNRIVDSGTTNGAAIDIQGGTESIVLSGNEIVETRAAAQRVGVRLGVETRNIKLRDNKITGFAEPVKQLK